MRLQYLKIYNPLYEKLDVVLSYFSLDPDEDSAACLHVSHGAFFSRLFIYC